MITHDDGSTAVLSEGRELLSVCGHLHSAYGTGIVVLREGGREGGRKGERRRRVSSNWIRTQLHHDVYTCDLLIRAT